MSVFDYLKLPYHFLLPFYSALYYGFPSHHIAVIGVTGTKGKSTTTELISAILEEAGYKTAVLNSIRTKVADESTPNETRMSMPGRFFIQSFLDRALAAHCRAAIIEMTSEGSRQFRHRAIALDALVFTNLAPEHIESHGSFENYRAAKLELGKQLVRSYKRPRIMVANGDDPASVSFLTLPVERPIPFSIKSDTTHDSDEHGGHFHFDDTELSIHLPGTFSLQNALAAATVCSELGISTEIIARALSKITTIPGRAERIEAGQDFSVVVDYAHTPESLTALYDAYGTSRKICVLGSTGGGRDTWKRPVMGEIAESVCDTVILTNEDPYDEDPQSIVNDIASKMRKKPEIIMDRREAIRTALRLAEEKTRLAQGTHENWAVLVSGKGTDPNICGPRGTKTPWSDAVVAREEIALLLSTRKV